MFDLRSNTIFGVFVVFCLVLSVFFHAPQAFATDYTGSSFQIRDPAQGMVGDDSSSTSFQHIGTGSMGAESTESTSSNFKLQSGFLYFSSSTQLTQNTYRWYDNTDAVQPTAALAAENTAITEVNYDDVLRLRMSIKAAGEAYPSGATFKLQFGDMTGVASCGAISSWTDVGAIGSEVLFTGANNATPSDGATISSRLLSTAANGSSQTYEESNSTGSTPSPIYVGTNADAEWDWVILNNEALAYTTYCFRMVQGSGTALTTYTNYPKLTTESGMITFSVSTNSVSLGNISVNSVASSSHTVSVTTNANSGYNLYVSDDGNLRSGANDIDDVSDGSVTAGSEEYGLNTGYSAFASDAAITTSMQLARSVTVPAYNSTTTCTYEASVTAATPTGTYTHTVRYTVAGVF